MSAIVEEPDGVTPEPIKVLIAVQDEFDLCDLAGPMEVFSWAQHDKRDAGEQHLDDILRVSRADERGNCRLQGLPRCPDWSSGHGHLSPGRECQGALLLRRCSQASG